MPFWMKIANNLIETAPVYRRIIISYRAGQRKHPFLGPQIGISCRRSYNNREERCRNAECGSNYSVQQVEDPNGQFAGGVFVRG